MRRAVLLSYAAYWWVAYRAGGRRAAFGITCGACGRLLWPWVRAAHAPYWCRDCRRGMERRATRGESWHE